MDELLIQILLGLTDLFFEFLLELASEGVLDLLSRSTGSRLVNDDAVRRVQMVFIYGCLGALAGAGSVMLFPHPFFHPSKIHGISLIISPIATAAVMAGLGSVLRRRGKRVLQIESFPCAFAFAFGMALIRFLHSA